MDDLARCVAMVAAARRIAVLTGAGVSAESGIPTFRGLGGLWNGRDPMRLATPEAFDEDPALVWEFYNWRRDLVSKAEPNPAHRALVELAARVPELTLITQNVDRLHQRAGSRDVLELHGNLFVVRCTGCRASRDRSGEVLPALPHCDECGHLLRPGVVWFGESLPLDTWSAAQAAVKSADLLLVVGTSAVVYPAAGLVTLAGANTRQVVEINVESTPMSGLVDLCLLGKAGEILPGVLARLGPQGGDGATSAERSGAT